MSKHAQQWLGALALLALLQTCSPAPDAPLAHFEAWIKATSKYYRSYLVVDMDGCNYCGQTAIKLIKDGYLEQNPLMAIVLVAKSHAEVYPVKDLLHLPNLLIYNLQEHNKPILAHHHRLYRHSKQKGWSFTELDANAFDKLAKRMFTFEMIPNKRSPGPTPAPLLLTPLKGIAIPGHEALLVRSDSGRVEVNTSW